MLRKVFLNLAYYQRPIWDTGISPPELVSFIAIHDPGRALELGCGTGTNAVTLAKAGWQVIGIDFARRAIQIAKQKAKCNGVQVDFRLADVTRLNSISGTFDFILDIGCFHALPLNAHQRYLATLERYLSNSGTYLLYVFFKSSAETIGHGVTEAAIDALFSQLQLVQRVDSTERGIRPSAWLTFHKRH